MNKTNLKPFQAGISGNPKGRPKGSRSVKKVIVDLLNDPNTNNLLPRNALRNTRTPLEAIISVLIIKSIRGDVRAIDTLLKYAVDRDRPVEVGGFFSKERLIIQVVGDRESSRVPLLEETNEVASTAN